MRAALRPKTESLSSSLTVGDGKRVRAGQVVGKMGHSGTVDVHLHFEWRKKWRVNGALSSLKNPLLRSRARGATFPGTVQFQKDRAIHGASPQMLMSWAARGALPLVLFIMAACGGNPPGSSPPVA